MKKAVSLLVAMLMLVAILAGCTQPSASSAPKESATTAASSAATVAPTEPAQPTLPPPSKLKVWMPPFGSEDTMDKDFWEKTLKTFGDQNNVTISVEIIPWGNYEEKYLTAITAGTGPDVGYMYIPMIADYIKLGAIDPLDNYMTAEDKANYIYLDLGVTNGKQYGFPFIVGNPRVLMCNMDILGKSGFKSPPKTWDELVTMGQQISTDNPKIYPFLQEWAEPAIGALNSIYYTYLWSAGGDLFNEDGSAVSYNSKNGLKAAQFLSDLKFKYKILPDVATSLKGTDVSASMSEGKVAMAVMGTSAATELDKAGINWDYTTALSASSDVQPKTFIAVDSLVLISTSQNKDMAAKAIKFMASGPIMTSFHKDLCMFPPIGKDEQYADNPKFKRMFDNDTACFKPLPNVPNSFKVYDTLYKNLQLMMLGQSTPEKALADAAAYAQTVLGK
jgi:multiple sugar transport system substrate-binding protein